MKMLEIITTGRSQDLNSWGTGQVERRRCENRRAEGWVVGGVRNFFWNFYIKVVSFRAF